MLRMPLTAKQASADEFLAADSVEERAEQEEKDFLILAENSLERHGLSKSEELCQVALHLRTALRCYAGTIVVGPPGSGKSTAFTCYAEAEEVLAEQGGWNLSGKPELRVLHPKIFESEELFCSNADLSGSTLLEKALELGPSLAAHAERAVQGFYGPQLVVSFDGPLEPGWADRLHSLLETDFGSGGCTLWQLGVGRVRLPTMARLLFEAEDLAHASPATVGRCGTLHVPAESVGSKRLLSAWIHHRLPQVAPWVPEDVSRHLLRLLGSVSQLLPMGRRPSHGGVPSSCNLEEAEEAASVGAPGSGGPAPAQRASSLGVGHAGEERVLSGGAGSGHPGDPASAQKEGLRLATTLLRLLEAVLASEPRKGKPPSPADLVAFAAAPLTSSSTRPWSSQTVKASSTNRSSKSSWMGGDAAAALAAARASEEPFDYMRFIEASLAFALTWSFGALAGAGAAALQAWCSSHLPGFQLPRGCSLQDVFVDWSCEDPWHWYFMPWASQLESLPQPALDPGFLEKVSINTQHSLSFRHLSHMLAQRQQSVLLSGAPGIGKSQAAAAVARCLEYFGGTWAVRDLFFRKCLRPGEVRQLSKSILEQRRPGRALADMKVLIMVEDVNMPATDSFGCKPALEVLRAFIDLQGLFVHNLQWRSGKDVCFLATSAAPLPGGSFGGASAGSSSEVLPARLARHFVELWMPEPPAEDMKVIFGEVTRQLLQVPGKGARLASSRSMAPKVNVKEAPAANDGVTAAVVGATLELYAAARLRFPATPARCICCFNFRDLVRMFQGLALAEPWSSSLSKEQLARLWAHEACRCFSDRLSGSTERRALWEVIAPLLESSFDCKKAVAGDGGSPLRFGRPQEGQGIYGEITDTEENISKRLQEAVQRYNECVQRPSDALQLVLFSSAVDHMLRMLRVLCLPGGNALCIGPACVGKTSTCRLASFLAGLQTSDLTEQLVMKRLPPAEKFYSFFRDAMKDCGFRRKPGCLLLLKVTDGCLEARLLDALHSLIRFGDVEQAWTASQRTEICKEFQNVSSQPESKADGNGVEEPMVVETERNIWKSFVARAKQQMHVALCLPPEGALLRAWCREMPGFISCCTLDCFESWPQDALQAVALQFISDSSFLKRVDAEEKLTAGGGAADRHFDNVGPFPYQSQSLEAASAVLPALHCIAGQVAQGYFSQEGGEGGTMAMIFPHLPSTFVEFVRCFIQRSQAALASHQTSYARLSSAASKLRQVATHVRSAASDLEAVVAKRDEQAQRVRELEQDAINDQTAFSRLSAEREQAEVLEHEGKIQKAVLELADSKPLFLAADGACQESLFFAIDGLDANGVAALMMAQQDSPDIHNILACLCNVIGKPTVDARDMWVLPSDLSAMHSTLRRLDCDKLSEDILTLLLAFDGEGAAGSRPFICHHPRATALAYVLRRYFQALLHRNRTSKRKVSAKEQLKDEEAARLLAQERLKVKLAVIGKVSEAFSMSKAAHAAAQKEQRSLQSQHERGGPRVMRARQISEPLTVAMEAWQARQESAELRALALPGASALAAASMIYLAPLTEDLRCELLAKWLAACHKQGLPVPADWSVQEEFVSQALLRRWELQGLPPSKHSRDSAALLQASTPRWILCLDPQQQAARWLRIEANWGEGRGLQIAKASDPAVLGLIATCMQHARSILVEGCGEEPPIMPGTDIVAKFCGGNPDTETKLGKAMFRLHGSRSFHLYLTTRLATPAALSPATLAANFAIINFALTFEGLAALMLERVVQSEAPSLQREWLRISESPAWDDMPIEEAENQLLQILMGQQMGPRFLEDDGLLCALLASTTVAEELAQKRESVASLKEELEASRNRLRSVAERAALVFQAAQAMSEISHFYAPSFYQAICCLEAGLVLGRSEAASAGVELQIGKADNDKDTEEWYIEELANFATFEMFHGLGSCLDTPHVLPFAFLASMGVSRRSGSLTDMQCALLWHRGRVGASLQAESESPRAARGSLVTRAETRSLVTARGLITGPSGKSSPDTKAIPPTSWDFVLLLAQLLPKTFAGLPNAILQNPLTWTTALQGGPCVTALSATKGRHELHSAERSSVCSHLPEPWSKPLPDEPLAEEVRTSHAGGPADSVSPMPAVSARRASISKDLASHLPVRRSSLSTDLAPHVGARQASYSKGSALGVGGLRASIAKGSSSPDPAAAGVLPGILRTAVDSKGLLPDANHLPVGLNPFEQLLLLKALQPELVGLAAAAVVAEELGPQYLLADHTSLEEHRRQARLSGQERRALLLISHRRRLGRRGGRSGSFGFADAGGLDVSELLRAELKSDGLPGAVLRVVSPVVDRGPFALEAARMAAKEGNWMLFQDCHLAEIDWLGELERLVEELCSGSHFLGGTERLPSLGPGKTQGDISVSQGDAGQQVVHENFRLFISLIPVDHFPQGLLQSCLKIAVQPPSGVRRRLRELVTSLDGEKWKGPECQGLAQDDDDDDGKRRQKTWCKFLFSLCVFHAVASERSQFEPFGFRIMYDFSTQDLSSSLGILWVAFAGVHRRSAGSSLTSMGDARFPWAGFTEFVASVSHGGRMADHWDRRRLTVTLARFLGPKAAESSAAAAAMAWQTTSVSMGGRAANARRVSVARQNQLTTLQASADQLFAYMNPDLNFGDHHFGNGRGRVPETAWEAAVQAAEKLPDEDAELFGMHTRQGKMLHLRRSNTLMSLLQGLGHNYIGSGPADPGLNLGANQGDSSPVASAVAEADMELHTDAWVLQLVKQLLSDIPGPPSESSLPPATESKDPLDLLLGRELCKLLWLLRLVRGSLLELQEAFAGAAPGGLREELEEAWKALLAKRVPAAWRAAAFLSNKPLASWAKSLHVRLEFIQKWSHLQRSGAQPSVFLIDCLWSPKDLLLSALRRAARRQNLSLEDLAFHHKIMHTLEDPTDAQEPPAHGVFTFGAQLRSGRWDTRRNILIDCKANESFFLMPVIHFLPEARFQPDPRRTCPVPFYQTERVRRKEQDSFAVVHLRTAVDQEEWLLKGLALFCEIGF
ncbi:unnamed protein product [Polarella glacialis]|uniref:Uncharacterized protein n=1 Tax=Polarella glacialis TaxID=89957 RepID=A0A813J180_POLGL|nr:unnamed protein product [Polarella glacialis]